jgi:putative redox protein
MQFTGHGVQPPSPAVPIDADGETGPSPMQALLMASAGCSGADVIHILGKMRIELRSLEIDVEGVRREEDPRRYVSVHLRFALDGDDLSMQQAERAVELSVQKYCSVLQTFAPDVQITHEIALA